MGNLDEESRGLPPKSSGSHAFTLICDLTRCPVLCEVPYENTERAENINHHTCLLRNLYAGQEATVRTGYGTTDWFKLGKKNIKAVYCHTTYLTYMQSTSREMPGWMKHKLESRLPGEIAITSDIQMTPPQ